MPYDIERFSQLIGSLYDVPFDSAALPAALGDLAALAGVEKTAVIGSLTDGNRAIVAAAGVSDDAIETYNSHFQRLDRVLPQSGTPPMAFTSTSVDAYWPDFPRSEFFNEWARPYHNVQIAFVTVPVEDTRSSLVLVASAEERGLGSPSQIMLLKLLAPHLRRAMTATAELADHQRQRQAVLGAFGKLQHGLVVLDRRALVVHATDPVTEMLKAGDGIRLTPRGLRAIHPSADLDLGALIAEALSCHESGHARALGPVRIPRRAPAPPLLVQAFPLPARSPRSRDPWTSGRPEDGAVILVFVDLAQRYRPPPELLRLAFGLTAAEAAVALRLLEGTGVKAVAADLGISDSTVRTHVLHIFSKTGTRRQAELVRLLTGLAPILATEPVRV